MVDTGIDRIQWMDVLGRFRRLKGSTGTGDEQFNNPTALAVDAVNGWIYVVDQGNHRIQKFDNCLRFLLSWGLQGDGDGQFQAPGDIAIDPAGD